MKLIQIKLTCNECDFTTTTFQSMNDHNKLEHIIEQLDGSTEESKKKEHNDLLCYKREKQQPNRQGWEIQFSINLPYMLTCIMSTTSTSLRILTSMITEETDASCIATFTAKQDQS